MNKQDKLDHTLRFASGKGNIERVIHLISKGANPNRYIKQRICIDFAVINFNNEVVKYLSPITNFTYDASSLSVEVNNIEIAKLLGCDFDHACHKQRYEIVRNCLSYNPYISHRMVVSSLTCPNDIVEKVLDMFNPWFFKIVEITSLHVTERIKPFLLKCINRSCLNDWINYLDKVYIPPDILADVTTIFINKPDYPVQKYLPKNVELFFGRYGIFFLIDQLNIDTVKCILLKCLEY